MIEIVKAQIEDLDATCKIWHEVTQLHENRDIFQKRTLEEDKQMIQGMISSESDDDIMYVAKKDNVIAGYALVTLKDKPSCYIHNKVAFIESMGVDKNHQDQGIGKALINKAKEWGKEKDASKLELNVYTFNEGAIKFYNKQGLKRFSQRMDISI